MTQVSEERIEEVAEAVASDPSTVNDDELTALLEGITHPDFDIYSPAGDALEELIEGLSDEEIDARFDADRLRGRLTTEDVSGGSALSAVLETLSETNPEAVRELRPEIRAGLDEYLRESEIKGVLSSVLTTDAETLEEARTLMAEESTTARNLGVRLVKDLVSRDEPIDDDAAGTADAALSDVWGLLTNGRESSKPRENAAAALAAHAEAYPEEYTDRVDEIAAVLRTNEAKVRYDVFDLPEAIAAHDPDAVAPLAPVARREFDDVTATGSTRKAAMEFLGTIVDAYPDAVTSLDPFVEYVEDDDNWYDESIARVVAAVGGPEHTRTLLDANEFDPELIGILVDGVEGTELDGLDGPERTAVRETVRDAVTDDDPETRVRALETVQEVLHDEFDDPAAIYLDRLVDQGADEHGYETVSVRAADGLEQIAAEDPARLVGEADRLFEAARTSFDDDERSFRGVTDAIATLAVADDSNEVYRRVADDLDADDGETRQVAVAVLFDGAAPAYPADLPDPVPTLLDLHDDDESTTDTHIRRILGELTHARPDAVEPAVDALVGWYDASEADAYDRNYVLADLGPDYPEAPVAFVDDLAEDYIEGFGGEYSHDDIEAAIALGHAAREDPDAVRSALAEFLDAAADDRPGSFPLVLIGLGDRDAVSKGFASENGWLAEQFAEDSPGQKRRLIRLVEAAEYEPAEPLLEAIETDAEASEPVAEAAAAALERLS